VGVFGVSLSPQLETDPRPVTEQFSQASGGNRQRLCENPVVIGGGSKETT